MNCPRCKVLLFITKTTDSPARLSSKVPNLNPPSLSAISSQNPKMQSGQVSWHVLKLVVTSSLSTGVEVQHKEIFQLKSLVKERKEHQPVLFLSILSHSFNLFRSLLIFLVDCRLGLMLAQSFCTYYLVCLQSGLMVCLLLEKPLHCVSYKGGCCKL